MKICLSKTFGRHTLDLSFRHVRRYDVIRVAMSALTERLSKCIIIQVKLLQKAGFLLIN